MTIFSFNAKRAFTIQICGIKAKSGADFAPSDKGGGGEGWQCGYTGFNPPPPPPPSPLVRRVICAVLACIVRQGGFNPEVQSVVLPPPPPYDGPYYKS